MTDVATKEVDVGYSPFMLAFGCVLPCLGAGIACYLLKLYVESHAEEWGGNKKEPEYVREINQRLSCNNVETERDLS